MFKRNYTTIIKREISEKGVVLQLNKFVDIIDDVPQKARFDVYCFSKDGCASSDVFGTIDEALDWMKPEAFYIF